MKISCASHSEMKEAFDRHFANIGHINWQETYLLLILFQTEKVMLSQQTRLSLLKIVAPMKSENYLKN